jgi:adenylylsulfate kinase-like enzyme
LVYLFTGQPGSGKTTIGKLLFQRLLENDNLVVQIDGDDLRDIFNNKDYSRDGRELNISKSHDIAYFLYKKGFDVIITMVSPYKDLRNNLKNKTEAIEIYVYTDDIRGREKYFAKDYEKPTDNYIEIDTTSVEVEKTFGILLEKIEKNKK